VPRDREEKMYFLDSLGFTLVKTFNELDKHFSMLFNNNVLVYPFEISVRYACFNFKVAHVDFYFQPLQVVVPYWLCLETISDAGLQPLIRLEGHQDMVWMCDHQAVELLNSTVNVPVKDNKGKDYYPETSYHLQYFFEVLYGLRGYEDDNGKKFCVATDFTIANKWRDAILAEGCNKLKNMLETNRYFKFLDKVDHMTVEQEKKKIYVVDNEVVKGNELINVLTARL
jgi:hypothetical protein